MKFPEGVEVYICALMGEGEHCVYYIGGERGL